MSAGGWLTNKEETIKDKASFTNIKMDIFIPCLELHMKVGLVSEDTLAKLVSMLVNTAKCHSKRSQGSLIQTNFNFRPTDLEDQIKKKKT